MADGLARILPPEDLTIIVNTGDDFEHLGLQICPDLDTVMYTIAGVANVETGWGRQGESWRTSQEAGRLGAPDWFSLGDLDLATHLTRTHLQSQGSRLTATTRQLCQAFGVEPWILPMSDQPAPTFIDSDGALIPFQEWFVRQRWQPRVTRVVLPEDVRAPARVIAALEKTDFVIVAPSNPFVSIDPILNVYPIREMVMDLPKAVIAVSPIIGGEAVKGPAAKMMAELELQATAATVATYYGELLDGFVYDILDKGLSDELAIVGLCVNTWMKTQEDRVRLAREALNFASRLERGR
jgi:LPPG:FO 2-phospho-L-lactate transferase